VLSPLSLLRNEAAATLPPVDTESRAGLQHDRLVTSTDGDSRAPAFAPRHPTEKSILAVGAEILKGRSLERPRARCRRAAHGSRKRNRHPPRLQARLRLALQEEKPRASSIVAPASLPVLLPSPSPAASRQPCESTAETNGAAASCSDAAFELRISPDAGRKEAARRLLRLSGFAF
jgi:hypothetical protein